MKIGIIGGGVVGKAVARAFMEHAIVKVYDKDPLRGSHTIMEVMESELVFVCLPTPQKEASLECDLSYVHGFFNTVKQAGWQGAKFVLRSTVSIGTTRRLVEQYGLPSLCHSPEFLTARCSLVDAQVPARNIIGCPDLLEGTWSGKNQAAQLLNVLYHQRFPGTPCHLVSSDESEAIKLFVNGFFATKIAYFNEIHQLSQRLGLNWELVLAGMLTDGRITHSHTQVPGPDGKFGYGGSCLPKDLANLITCLYQAGEDTGESFQGPHPTLTLAVHIRNQKDRVRKQ